MRVGVLDWHQEPGERARTFLSVADAERLVARLAAEPIRHGLIRMFAPDSVFYALRPIAPQIRFIPAVLPPVEIENCHFAPPENPNLYPNMAAVRDLWEWEPGGRETIGA